MPSPGASRLHSMEINSTYDADNAFGNAPGLLVVTPQRGWAPYLIIPEGYYALVTTSGAEQESSDGTPVWPSGFTTASLFTKVSHLVTKSFCVFDVPVKGCKTKDNVTVTIDCSIVFRIMGDANKDEDPSLVRKFVHEVTPAGLEQQLKDAMAEEVRSLARALKHTDVYSLRSGVSTVNAEPIESKPAGFEQQKGADESKEGGVEMTAQEGDKRRRSSLDTAEVRELGEEEAATRLGVNVTQQMEANLNKQFVPQGVKIHDIMIQNVSLPDDINQQMSNKTLVRSKQEYEVMEQNFEMQSIRLKNETAKLKLEHTEAQEMARIEGQKETQEVRDTLEERKAARAKVLQEYEQGTVTAVNKISAEAREVTTRLNFEYHQVLQTLKLEAEEKAAKIEADAAAKVEELQAETKRNVATNEGEATKALAAAEAKSNSFLIRARQFELVDRHLDVYEQLVFNPGTVITDSQDADFNKLILADSVLATHANLSGSGRNDAGAGGNSGNSGGESHNALLSALHVLRLAGTAYGLRSDTYIPQQEVVNAPPGESKKLGFR